MTYCGESDRRLSKPASSTRPSGVSLKRIVSDQESLTIEVDPDPDTTYTIEFVGTRQSADIRGEAVLDEEGQTVHATKRLVMPLRNVEESFWLNRKLPVSTATNCTCVRG